MPSGKGFNKVLVLYSMSSGMETNMFHSGHNSDVPFQQAGTVILSVLFFFLFIYLMLSYCSLKRQSDTLPILDWRENEKKKYRRYDLPMAHARRAPQPDHTGTISGFSCNTSLQLQNESSFREGATTYCELPTVCKHKVKPEQTSVTSHHSRDSLCGFWTPFCPFFFQGQTSHIL